MINFINNDIIIYIINNESGETMKRIFIFVAIVSFFCCTGFTATLDNRDYNNVVITENNKDNDIEVTRLSNTGGSDLDCETLFGNENDEKAPAYWIQLALSIIKYIGIVLLVVYSVVDFVKAITEQDNDALKKASNRTIKRLIYVILLFFVPIIVSFVMNFLGLYGTCGYGEGGVITYVN